MKFSQTVYKDYYTDSLEESSNTSYSKKVKKSKIC